MRVTVARRYRFTASHHLPEFPAPYNVPHSHRYTVEVVAESNIGDPVDTDLIDQAWNWRAPAAGSDLNERYAVTTVEALAVLWLSRLRKTVPQVVAVSVWEDEERCGRATLAS